MISFFQVRNIELTLFSTAYIMDFDCMQRA
jgi:hypothetical protein